MYGDPGYHGDVGWGGWLLMALTMLAFLALVAWGVFLVWRSTSGPARHEEGDVRRRPSAPEDILGERLARGEIDPDEYRARLDALRHGRSP